jgi:putative oxidoreductase
MAMQVEPATSSRGTRQPTLARWAAIPLRMIVGYGFMAHGYAKLVNGPDHFIGIVHALGVPAPEFLGWMTILTELTGGLAVLIGAFVPVVSVPMAAVLLVAVLTVHLPYGFSSIKLQSVTAAGPRFGQPGYETALLYLVCLATLVMGGSGPWSVDGRLARIRRNRDDTARRNISRRHRHISIGRCGSIEECPRP